MPRDAQVPKTHEPSRALAVIGVVASLIAILGFATGIFTWDDLRRRVQRSAEVPAIPRFDQAGADLSLRVISNAPNARVYLNGKRVAETPADLKAFSGHNVITVVRPGCSAERQRVTTNDIAHRLLRFNLDCNDAWLTDHPAVLRDIGECPFEGCVYREWIATEKVIARVSPYHHAAEAFRIDDGEWVTAVTGEVVTKSPGLAVLAGELTRYCGQAELRLHRGTEIHLYSYHGEGSWLAFYKGEPCDGIAIDEEELRMQPATEWWVKVVSSSGAVGWVLADKNFDNWDQLS